MRKLDSREIKDIELNILIEFDKFCEANHLYYVMCGGTLLGAVRHKGFIPWDDDIDVLMPRPDYDRLINGEGIDFSSLPDYLRVASWKNGEIKFPFMKMLDTRTKVKVDFFDAEQSVDKIWIDIFPIDGNPHDEAELKKLYKKSIRWRKILCLKTAQPGEGKTKLKRLLKPFLIKLVGVFSFDYLCRKIDKISTEYNFDNCEEIGGVLWGYGPQERVNKKAFMTPVKLEFEGKQFNAPSNWDEYLTGLYKDYMQLPPEDKRVQHGMTAFIKGESDK